MTRAATSESYDSGTARVCPECRQGKCPNCTGVAWDDELDAEVRCEHDCRTPTPDDVPLFLIEVPPIPVLVEEERISDGQRRTRRQAADIAHGKHPLTRTPLHADASRDRDASSGKRDPFTCGSCELRVTFGHHTRSYAKCTLGAPVDRPSGGPLVTHSSATDVRAWWPACRDYRQNPEVVGVSPLTSVGPQ